MNDQERAICRRLGILRKQLGWTQTEFAHAFDTKRDQLASVEYGRNPLRYWLADRVCERLDVCQQWLACGEDPMRGYVRLPLETGLEIKPKELFSAAWHRRVGHLVKREVKASEAMKQILANDPNAPDKILANRLYWLVGLATQHIPPELYHAYFDTLTAETSAFISSHALQGTYLATGTPPKAPQKNSLRNVSDYVNLASVKPQMPNFLDRLKKMTAERGKKTALAKFLGVPLASVSQWLSGDREPGGERTLRMLRWVEQQERQK